MTEFAPIKNRSDFENNSVEFVAFALCSVHADETAGTTCHYNWE